MKFKLLVQLSHGITMLFGVAFGITISLLYQYQIQAQLTLLGLVPLIIIIVLIGCFLRAYTLYFWSREKSIIKEIFNKY
jgi:hypothetical protein|tara:strand:+ start:2560 stop:2796 length:237 start_codon:yes stop_codon:yes gene_type:complete